MAITPTLDELVAKGHHVRTVAISPITSIFRGLLDAYEIKGTSGLLKHKKAASFILKQSL